jgi:hypothetical protein
VGIGEGAVQASSGGESKQLGNCRINFISGMAARWQGEHGKAVVKENRKQVVLIRHTWTGTDRVQLNKKRREGEPERNAYVICDHVKRICVSVVVGVEYVHDSEFDSIYLQRNNAERTVTTWSTVERGLKRWDAYYIWTNGRKKKK